MPPVPALELTFRGANDVVAFACPRCGTIVTPNSFGEESEANEIASKLASEHCDKHCRCGASIPNNRIICKSCWEADQSERDDRKFTLAVKVEEKDYGDPVYWSCHPGSMGDGYFESVDELRDYCEDSDVALPKYVWACNPVELEIDVDNILESAFQEHHEGARDALAPGAEAELSVFLLGWCARQNILSWQTDYRKAIILSEKPTETAAPNQA